MSEYSKPLPEFRPETKPYWEATKNHKLVLPRSKTTGEYFFYPRAVSPGEDMTDDIEWVESSGKGKVWTFSIHHMGPSKAYKGEPPYIVASPPSRTTSARLCRAPARSCV